MLSGHQILEVQDCLEDVKHSDQEQDHIGASEDPPEEKLGNDEAQASLAEGRNEQILLLVGDCLGLILRRQERVVRVDVEHVVVDHLILEVDEQRAEE